MYKGTANNKLSSSLYVTLNLEWLIGLNIITNINIDVYTYGLIVRRRLGQLMGARDKL